MGQALCRLAARLAGLAAVVSLGNNRVLLLSDRPRPAWLEPPLRWLLARAGFLQSGEESLGSEALGATARARAAAARPRAEFVPGAFAVFRARALRDGWDFASISRYPRR